MKVRSPIERDIAIDNILNHLVDMQTRINRIEEKLDLNEFTEEAERMIKDAAKETKESIGSDLCPKCRIYHINIPCPKSTAPGR